MECDWNQVYFYVYMVINFQQVYASMFQLNVQFVPSSFEISNLSNLFSFSQINSNNFIHIQLNECPIDVD